MSAQEGRNLRKVSNGRKQGSKLLLMIFDILITYLL